MGTKSVEMKKEGEFKEQELDARTLKEIEEKRSIIEALNQIKYPINATVFSHGMTWTMRNIAFWQSLKGKDEKVQEFIETYLTERK